MEVKCTFIRIKKMLILGFSFFHGGGCNPFFKNKIFIFCLLDPHKY